MTDKTITASDPQIVKQVADWRKEIARLQDLVNVAQGNTETTQDTEIIAGALMKSDTTPKEKDWSRLTPAADALAAKIIKEYNDLPNDDIIFHIQDALDQAFSEGYEAGIRNE